LQILIFERIEEEAWIAGHLRTLAACFRSLLPYKSFGEVENKLIGGICDED
jgi:hypothetical protein